MDLMNQPDKAAVQQARQGVAGAEQESAEARSRAGELASALDAAVTAYDSDPTEDNGRAVIAAREAKDLADLRKERAERREQAARAQLAAVEKDFALEEARYAVCQVKIDVARSAHEAEQARAIDRAKIAAEELQRAVQVFKHGAAEELQAVDVTAAEHAKNLRRLEGALATLAGLAPESTGLAEELEETRATIARVEIERASAATFHARAVNFATMINVGVALVREGIRGMGALLAALNERAEIARQKGIRVSDIDGAHVAAAALLALQEAAGDAITRPGIAALLTRQVLVQGDVSGATRRGAINSPLRSLLAVWGRAIEAGPLDDRGQPEELEAKLRAAMGANTEQDAARAVEAAQETFRQSRRAQEAEERARSRREADPVAAGALN